MSKNYEPKDPNFTKHAKKVYNDLVDDEIIMNNAPPENQAQLIYDSLIESLPRISFSAYLKRLLFKKSGRIGDYIEVSFDEYKDIIKELFKKNGINPSYASLTSGKQAKISTLAGNWLKSDFVERSTIFLMGFGLDLNIVEVSSLLQRQGERDFNFKNSDEIIYWFCFKYIKNKKFVKMRELKEKILSGNGNNVNENETINIKKKFEDIGNNEDLFIEQLSKLKFNNDKHSVTVYNQFMELYDEVVKKISENRSKNYKFRNSHIEQSLYGNNQYNSDHNLKSMSESKLAHHFQNRRLNRQRISKLIKNKSKTTFIDRFDLITLNFFIYSKREYQDEKNNRLVDFKGNMNGILNKCSMGELYYANPYENFILLCISTDEPLNVFKAVLKKSFSQEK